MADSSKDEVFSYLYCKLSDRIMKLFEEDFDKKQSYIELIIPTQILEYIFTMLEHIINEGIPDKRLETIKNLLKILNKLCFYSPKSCFMCFKNKIENVLEKIFSLAEKMTKGTNFFLKKIFCFSRFPGIFKFVAGICSLNQLNTLTKGESSQSNVKSYHI